MPKYFPKLCFLLLSHSASEIQCVTLLILSVEEGGVKKIKKMWIIVGLCSCLPHVVAVTCSSYAVKGFPHSYFSPQRLLEESSSHRAILKGREPACHWVQSEQNMQFLDKVNEAIFSS